MQWEELTHVLSGENVLHAIIIIIYDYVHAIKNVVEIHVVSKRSVHTLRHSTYSEHKDQNFVSGGRLEEVKNNGKF